MGTVAVSELPKKGTKIDNNAQSKLKSSFNSIQPADDYTDFITVSVINK